MMKVSQTMRCCSRSQSLAVARNRSQSLAVALVFGVFILFIAPLATQAALYAPGATLNPACAPTDSNCGIATTTSAVASGTTNSIPYYASNGSLLSATSSLTILPNGNVGIGTTSPTYLLTVNGTIQGALQDVGGQVYSLKAYGARCDGKTDDTAALMRAITAAYNNGGGTIFVPVGKCLIKGQITLPNDNTASNSSIPYSRQPSIRITGVGGVQNGQGQRPNSTYGGSVLELTYASSTSYKIQTFGLGLLEMDHLTFWDPSGDNTPFFLTTGTTVNIHDDAFIGSKSGQQANQDVLMIGGSLPHTYLNNPNAAFQGYDSSITNNYFNYIRRAVYAKTWVASLYVSNNFIGPGSGSNLVGGAAMVFDGSAIGNNTVDNHIVNNRCEISGYYYCMKFIASQNNYIAGTDVEDAMYPYNTSVYFFDASSTGNMVLLNSAPNTGGITPLTHVTDMTVNSNSPLGQNLILDSTQSAPSVMPGSTLSLKSLLTTNSVGIGTTTPSEQLSVRSSYGGNIFGAYSVSGNKVFTVLDNGFVGIGTSSPMDQLTISGGNITLAGDAGNGNKNNLHIIQTTNTTQNTGGWYVSLGHNGCYDGYFNIGTTTACNSYTRPSLQITNHGQVISEGGFGVKDGQGFGSLSGYAYASYEPYDNISQGILNFRGATNAKGIFQFRGWYNNGTWHPVSNVLNLIASASGGAVGIGTTTPAATLGVAGLMYIGGTGTSTIQSNLHVFGTLRSTNSYVGDLIFKNGFRFTESPESSVGKTLFLKNENGVDIFSMGSDGGIGIGTTTPYSRLTVWGPDTLASTSAFTVANNASTTEFQVFDDGNATLAGSLTQNSDRRLKTDITPLNATTSLALIDKLQPVSYIWKSGADASSTQLGFIAQDVQRIFPNLVATTSATKYTPGGTLGLNYIGIIPPLVEAVKTLAGEVSGLTQSVTTNILTAVTGNFTHVQTQDIYTQKLCVGTTCVTAAQLNVLLQRSGHEAGTAPVGHSSDTSQQSVASSTSQALSGNVLSSSGNFATSTNATSTLQTNVASSSQQNTSSTTTTIASTTSLEAGASSTSLQISSSTPSTGASSPADTGTPASTSASASTTASH